MGKQYRVRVKSMNPDGSGMVEFNNRKFALKGVLPGELVTMELVYRANETGAKLCEVIEPSKERVTPPCKQFGICGGCQLLHMSEEAQKAYKQKVCEDLLGSFGKVSPILTAEHAENYRNKVHAAFSFAWKKDGKGGSKGSKDGGASRAGGNNRNRASGGKRVIISGIYEENSHHVVPTDQCFLQDARAAAYLKTVRQLMEQTQTAPYNEDTGAGILRYVFLRFAKETGQVLMALVTGTAEFPAKAKFAAEIKKKHPEIVTLVHNVNPAKNSMVLGKKETVLYGNGTIEDVLCGCRFRISSASFYQVNPEQTKRLYEKAISLAGLTSDMTVLDAYSGIGTISLIAAKTAGKVIGVELNKKAVEDAVVNARLNDCKNVEFVCADAGEYMVAAAEQASAPDVVFMDPPRAGSDEKFLSSLVKASPSRIVYISCNPETQARDLKYLTKNGYAVKEICPVDMFPGTRHCECVVYMQKIK